MKDKANKTSNILSKIGMVTLSISLIIFLFSFIPKQETPSKSISNNDVESFLYEWFANFDHHPDVNEFLEHIAEPVDMAYPDFPIRSKDDFKNWYNQIWESITWNRHALQNVEIITKDDTNWQLSYDIIWKAVNNEGDSIQMYIHQDASIKENNGILQFTKLRAYERNIEHQETHLTALMKAAGYGEVSKVKNLLNNGANLFTIDPITGTSVVHFAAQGGNVEVMKILVENGAESIINLQAASNGFTPLMVATWYQNPEMIQYLLTLDHINPLIKDHYGRIAADFPVVAKGYDELHPIDQKIKSIFKEYFEKRDQYIADKFEADGFTPKRLPEDVNIRIPNGNKGNDYHTAALVAARDNHLELFEKLVIDGADLTLEGEPMKAVVTHKAAYRGNPEIMRLIVFHPDFDKIKNAQGPTNGYTPLHDAIWHGHTETAKILIDAGVDTTLRAWDGMTPLELAKKLDYQDIIQLFE
ncbi:ankyrin repeat domain-containing protein [Sediminitomix flava]|nr:ankyrin repeat domain-containing protein [Sediminitomix flava]